MIELLSPAGDKERLKIALLYGADAVYLGGPKYGLRANATNFLMDELKEYVEYAHSLNKKVYVTVNIVFHNEELDGLEEYLTYLSDINVDAIIVSDPVVIDTVKKLGLDLEIHLSTQASVLNSRAAKYYKDLGVKRIVLAREASKEDIIRIKEETGLDIECFIQGAMCTSFSGRCVLSNYTTNRDANRGGCAQVCRWSFKCDYDESFEMMSKDLNMITEIASMIDDGVNSFKIEGRMRSIYYIATVLYIYRRVLERIKSKTLTHEYIEYATNIINRVANRDSVSQFYRGLPTHNEQYYNGRIEESNQDFLGLVLDSDGKYLTLEVRNYFKLGDTVQVFGPNSREFEFTIDEILNEDNETIEICNHPKEIVKIRCSKPVEKMSIMRIKVFDILDEL